MSRRRFSDRKMGPIGPYSYNSPFEKLSQSSKRIKPYSQLGKVCGCSLFTIKKHFELLRSKIEHYLKDLGILKIHVNI
jgi:hypothetical protein